MLGDAQRRNGWQLAETAGDATPYSLQQLLERAVWSADAARDTLYACVAEHLGNPAGVVVIDETGFPKKGSPLGRGSPLTDIYTSDVELHG